MSNEAAKRRVVRSATATGQLLQDRMKARGNQSSTDNYHVTAVDGDKEEEEEGGGMVAANALMFTKLNLAGRECIRDARRFGAGRNGGGGSRMWRDKVVVGILGLGFDAFTWRPKG